MNKRIRDKKVKEYVERFRLYKKLGAEIKDIGVHETDSNLHVWKYDLKQLCLSLKQKPEFDGEREAYVLIDGIRIFSVIQSYAEFYKVFPELKPKVEKRSDYIEIDGVKFFKE